jgi:hypothetical protein
MKKGPRVLHHGKAEENKRGEEKISSWIIQDTPGTSIKG